MEKVARTLKDMVFGFMFASIFFMWAIRIPLEKEIDRLKKDNEMLKIKYLMLVESSPFEQVQE